MMLRPAVVFPPGETLRDELEERGWTQAEFAEILGRPQSRINEILNGKRAITPDLARDLSAAFGTSPEFWLNLEAQYQLYRLREKPEGGISQRAALYNKVPVKEMVKRGWIEPSSNVDVLEADICRFLGIDHIDDEPELPDWAARKSNAYVSDATPAEKAWLFRAKQLSQAVYATSYDPKLFDSMVAQLRLLLHAAQEVRHVPRVLSDHGVRLVVCQHLPKTRIDGACFWVSHQPTIALSLRFDRLDHFWFVLMHELGHVRDRGTSIDRDLQATDSEEVSTAESLANEFAAATLIPQPKLDDFVARVRPIFSAAKVEGFAHKVGVHPAIVVGQLQHRKEIEYRALRNTLVPVRDTVIASALTDGWGSVPPVGELSSD